MNGAAQPPDEHFPGFNEQDDSFSISHTKKRRLDQLGKSPPSSTNNLASNSSTTPTATMPAPSQANSSSKSNNAASLQPSPSTSPNLPPSSNHNATKEMTAIVFLREDKKQIPFNFVNCAIAKWEILKYVDQSSFIRISKGTVIKANVSPENVNKYLQSNKMCTIEGVEYETYAPKKYTPHLAELTLDLRDLEDRSILAMTPSDLLSNLKTPGDRTNNNIISVDKLYPRKTISSAREQSTITSIRVSIEFSNHIPERVYFQNVSVPISEYTLPPKRCFTCQRLGHSSISCRRKVACPNCAEPHTFDKCTVTNKENFKCVSCNQNHKASSTSCDFYKQALLISAELQKKNITQEQAAKLYVSLYDNNVKEHTNQGQPTVPQKVTIPGVVFESQASSSNSDFPTLPPSSPPLPSPSPVIRTHKKRSAPPMPNLCEMNQASSSSTEISNSLSLSLSDPFPSSQDISDTQQTADSYITPAQRPKKSQNPRPTPFHLTDTYAQVINGSLWDIPDRQESEELPLDSQLFPEYPTNNKTRTAPPDQDSAQASNSTTSSPDPTASISDFILDFLKKAMNKVMTWIKDKIKHFLQNDNISSLVQGLFSSFLSTGKC